MEQELSEIELCRNNFISYCIAQYPSFVFPRHIILIAHYLEKVARGEINRLIIFAPPRHGKSETVSKLFPCWYIGHHKGERTVAIATYGQDLSNEIGISLNQRMNSDVYREIFPESTPSSSANAIKRLVTINGGGYITVGVGGGLTGKGAHLRILDDPNKNREEAESELEQKKQQDWWTSVFMTRGEGAIKESGSSAEEDGPIVVILTRWSDMDLAKWLMDKQKEEEEAGINGDRWTILNLPAICEEEGDLLGRPPCPDPSDPTTWEDKHALWPEKVSAKRLQKLCYAVGWHDWNALYQQRPSSSGGDVYQRKAFQFYGIGGIPQGADKPVGSWDCNYKETNTSDFAVGLIAQVYKKVAVYIRKRYKGRWTLPQLLDKVRLSKIEFPDLTAIYVEEKANGRPVIDTLSLEIPGFIPVEPRQIGDKDSRNNAASKYQVSGVVYLPLGEPWVDDFIDNVCAWPNGKYDDDADSLAQLLIMELGQPTTDALIKHLENMLAERGIDAAKMLVDPNDPYALYCDESQIKKVG